RRGHLRGEHQKNLRSVFYHQDDREGNGARAGCDLRNNPGAWRPDFCRQLARRRHTFPAQIADTPGRTSKLPMNGNGRVLVVDDEEIMREVLSTLLTAENYSVDLA